MNFAIATIGHSFKGSMAYYLHDKRADKDNPHPATSERVGWTETRNLAAASDPATATRLMIATAQSADQLKAAAGVKATGRKSTRGPVFAFAMSWHPDEAESIDRKEMTRCADQALKILGLDHLQAVIIAHTDTAHPHVHVVVNRVNPENGKATAINGMAVKKLDAWANKYEQERGAIYSPNRAKKYEKIAEKKAAHPDPAERAAYVEKKKTEPVKAAVSKEPPATDRLADLRKLGDHISRLSESLKAEQKQDWQNWGESEKKTRKAIYDRAAADREAAAAAFKELTKSDWAKHFREQRERERLFFEREKSIVGILLNAVETAGYQFREKGAGQQGRLSLVFANVFDSEARRAVFNAAQSENKNSFMAIMREKKAAALSFITERRRVELVNHSHATAQAKAAMLNEHKLMDAEIRREWKDLATARAKVLQSMGPRGRKPRADKQYQPKTIMKDDFGKAGGLAPVKSAGSVPTVEKRLSTPAPSLRPEGIMEPPRTEARLVPVVDKAASVQVQKQPSARRDWSQPAAPASSTPADAAASPRVPFSVDKYKLTEEQKKAAREQTPTQRPDGPKQRF